MTTKPQKSMKVDTGLQLCWEEVSRAKFRCGLGSIIQGDGVSYAQWQDWQHRLLDVEEEMIAELKWQGKWRL